MNSPKRYRRIPTEINAIQWTGDNQFDIEAFGANVIVENGCLTLYVAANNAWLPLERGEWIAQDEHGFYPIKDDQGRPFNYQEA
ncbi:hypothetical protein HWB99_gp104 [Mycobacterium phage DrLupo]|uniref:Uncharacterized protein n=1 Tax=Mycobacterium phage DrLupo TaxID=2499037 RepID=A0A3S9UQT8_9CAUD|nr:hypothetical protein HWB99_gp104 [Mycobacterium phage DrLupo]AZS12640.1 hypothetical protein SEA_DRLUPO_104 [Mycobacterium phage DrLupo]